MYNLYIKKTQKPITDSFYISFLQKSNNPALFEVYLKDSEYYRKAQGRYANSDLVFYLYYPIRGQRW